MCLLVFTAVDTASVHFWNIDSSSNVWASGGLPFPQVICSMILQSCALFSCGRLTVSPPVIEEQVRCFFVSLQYLSQPAITLNKANPLFCCLAYPISRAHQDLSKAHPSTKLNPVPSYNFSLCVAKLKNERPKLVFFPCWDAAQIPVIQMWEAVNELLVALRCRMARQQEAHCSVCSSAAELPKALF